MSFVRRIERKNLESKTAKKMIMERLNHLEIDLIRESYTEKENYFYITDGYKNNLKLGENIIMISKSFEELFYDGEKYIQVRSIISKLKYCDISEIYLDQKSKKVTFFLKMTEPKCQSERYDIFFGIVKIDFFTKYLDEKYIRQRSIDLAGKFLSINQKLQVPKSKDSRYDRLLYPIHLIEKDAKRCLTHIDKLGKKNIGGFKN